jgi:hypothetical protein
MVKHNNVIGNGHFKKDWQQRVKTWFNQPAQKAQRRQKRVAKAKQVAPRPLNSLRPAVRCPTIKYNRKVRAGRGFTAAELKVPYLVSSLASLDNHFSANPPIFMLNCGLQQYDSLVFASIREFLSILPRLSDFIRFSPFHLIVEYFFATNSNHRLSFRLFSLYLL